MYKVSNESGRKADVTRPLSSMVNYFMDNSFGFGLWLFVFLVSIMTALFGWFAGMEIGIILNSVCLLFWSLSSYGAIISTDMRYFKHGADYSKIQNRYATLPKILQKQYKPTMRQVYLDCRNCSDGWNCRHRKDLDKTSLLFSKLNIESKTSPYAVVDDGLESLQQIEAIKKEQGWT